MDFISFCIALRAYCLVTGGSVTSWGRTAAHNAAVGGVATSNHLKWLACDVVYDSIPELATAQAEATHYGLHVLRETDHDHISPAAGPY